MKGTILLNYKENTHQIEEEERNRFLRFLLEQMELPISDFWSTDAPLTINQKIKLREVLTTYGIQVVDDLDGRLQVYVDKEIIGNWEKPTYKIKRDLREVDPRKQLYLEMYIEYDSIFDDKT